MRSIYIAFHLQSALKTSLNSRYFYACILYCVYTLSFVVADCISDVIAQNRIYVSFGILHMIDATLFAFSWVDRSFFDAIIIPDYLNIICSVLWLWSATTYNDYYISTSVDNVGLTDDFFLSRKLELAATTIEMVACFGWFMAWYTEYAEKYSTNSGKYPNRGLTFRDPDFNANGWSLFFPAIVYLAYEIQVYMHPDSYANNYLYVKGDIVYFFNSLFYLFGCLRDHGWYYSELSSSEEYSGYTSIDQSNTPLIVTSFPENPERMDYYPK